nr:response regulator transcription factor [Bacteriovorax sp. HI3]
MNSTPASYFLVDDHSLLLEGLKSYLGNELPSWTCCGHAMSVSEARDSLPEIKPSYVFIDHLIGKSTGADLIRSMPNDTSAPVFILVSQLDSKAILKEYMQLGVLGFVSKKDNQIEIKKALEQIAHNGEIYFSPTFNDLISSTSSVDLLTPKEIEITRLTASGKTNKEVASKLGCSELTVKTHKANIMRKLNVNNSVEICNWALKNNLL